MVVTRLGVSSPDDSVSPKTTSERVVEEIVTTERAYVKSLEDIVKVRRKSGQLCMNNRCGN